MQRILSCELSPEQYIESRAHTQVRPELVCPHCARVGRLHRHGAYERGLTGSWGQLLRIWVARFLCRACRRTVSYLPDFALPYRLVGTAALEAFLEGHYDGVQVQRWTDLLAAYRRRMLSFSPRLLFVVGCGLGRAPPVRAEALWPWLKEACGSLRSAARQLVTQFKITVLGSYQCHQCVRQKKPNSRTDLQPDRLTANASHTT